MNNKIYLSLSLLSLSLLQACGGGSDNGASGFIPAAGTIPVAAPAGAPSTASTANTGSVSASFVRSDRARYQLLGVGVQSFGALTASEQAASGAMTRLSGNTLTGQSATKEINGDASFALGRWAAGTVTRTSGAETLTGTDNRAYHYIALNTLAAMPAARSTTCDAGAFTAPTYMSGGSGVTAYTGATSGTATLSFDGTNAIVGGTLNVTVGGVTATVPLDTRTSSLASTSITGHMLSGGSGAAVALGDHGANAYLVAAGYSAVLPSGALYSGVAAFNCH